MRRVWSGVLIFSIIALQFAGLLQVFAQTVCDEVLIIFARGSRQDQSNIEEQREYTTFVNGVKERTQNIASIGEISLNYPARGELADLIEAEFSWFTFGEYRSSVDEGIRNAKELLETQAADCKDQKFVLGGYSQGAHVMGDVLSGLSQEIRDRVIYVALFGDPKFNFDSYAAMGTFQRRTITLRIPGGILEPRVEFPAEFQGRLHSWCRKDDGFCENKITKLKEENGSTHTYYVQREIPIAAGAAAARIKRAFAQPFTTTDFWGYPRSEKLDIVFATEAREFNDIKESLGQMRGRIERIMAMANSLGSDTRFGLNVYKTFFASSGWASDKVPLTYDKQAIINKFAGINTAGKKQALYYGLHESLEFDWRPDARKIVIALPMSIKDEFVDETGIGLDDVISKAKTEDISFYPVIGENAAADIVDLFDGIAKSTGGISFQRSRYITDDAGYMIENVLAAMSASEDVYFGKPLFGVPNTPVNLGISAISNPFNANLHYFWFFTPKDEHDASTKLPAVSHTYAAPYSGLVKVQIREDNLTIGQMVLPVKVSYETSLPVIVGAPRNVKVKVLSGSAQTPGVFSSMAVIGLNQTLQTQSIELSWESPAFGVESLNGYKIYDADGNLLGFAAPNQKSATINNVPKDADLNLRVSAMNDAVESTPEAVSEIEQPESPGNDSSGQSEANDDISGAVDATSSESVLFNTLAAEDSQDGENVRNKAADAGEQIGEAVAGIINETKPWYLAIPLGLITMIIFVIQKLRKF